MDLRAKFVRRIALGLLLAGLGSGLNRCWPQNVSEQYLLAAANRERTDRGLTALRLDEHLAQAARSHADEMARQGEISHQFGGEADLATRAGGAGAKFSLVTENVAEASNSALIHSLWMNSAGHRANLLDAAVDSVGIAVVERRGQLYAVEDFARRVESLSFEQQEAAVGQILAGSGMRVSTGGADARQTCAMSTGYSGGRQPWFVMRYTAADIRSVPGELTARIATHKYHAAAVGACVAGPQTPFTSYSVAVMLFP